MSLIIMSWIFGYHLINFPWGKHWKHPFTAHAKSYSPHHESCVFPRFMICWISECCPGTGTSQRYILVKCLHLDITLNIDLSISQIISPNHWPGHPTPPPPPPRSFSHPRSPPPLLPPQIPPSSHPRSPPPPTTDPPPSSHPRSPPSSHPPPLLPP